MIVPEKDVIILDITRKGKGHVGISGVYKDAENGYCEIRPVPPKGALRNAFLNRASGLIEPFSIVRFNFVQQAPVPPHAEDHIFELRGSQSAVVVGKIEGIDQRRLLGSISKQYMNEIYGEKLINNKFVYSGETGRSLGCLKIFRVSRFFMEEKEGIMNIRIGFSYKNEFYQPKLVEKSIYDYIGAEIEKGTTLEQLRFRLELCLREARPVYMRMGLSRPHLFENDPDRSPKCYVVINGLHTFPDYTTQMIPPILL
jgi:hypothetical protein